jgi:hypothetical protein
MNVFRPLLPLLVSTALFAQTPAPLLDAKLLDLLHESLSGELAKEYVIGISRHHRIQGSRGYRGSPPRAGTSPRRSSGWSSRTTNGSSATPRSR